MSSTPEFTEDIFGMSNNTFQKCGTPAEGSTRHFDLVAISNKRSNARTPENDLDGTPILGWHGDLPVAYFGEIPEEVLDIPADFAVEDDPDLEHTALSLALSSALSLLAPTARDAIRLRFGNQMTYDEIARHLGLADAAAVNLEIMRAFSFLRHSQNDLAIGLRQFSVNPQPPRK